MPDRSMAADRHQLFFRTHLWEKVLLLVVATIAFDIRLSPIVLQGVGVPILLFEFPLGVLLVLTLVELVRSRWRPTRLVGWVGTLLGALFVMSAVVHPSWFVAIRLYRFAAAAALSYWIFTALRSSTRSPHLYVVVASVALFQAYLATGQHILGKGMGYSFLGEGDYLYGGSEGPGYVHGTFPLHHILAGFTMTMVGLLMQARWPREQIRRWWFVVVAAATVPIGFAYSRMGAVAWLSVVGVLGLATLRRPRPQAGVFVAILVGGLLSGIVGLEGWNVRATETVQGDEGDDEGADVGGRIGFALQAARVVERQPLFGTGIGRYLAVARQQQGEDVQLIAHNVPLLVAAENGLVAGILVVVLLGIAGLAAVRAGPMALAVFSTYLAFILFDHFPYEDTQGIAMTGMWIGAFAAATKSAQEA